MWQAILRRGDHSFEIEWIKGHAKDEDVLKGNITREDMEGNHAADNLADKGADSLQKGFREFLQWCAARQGEYAELMNEIRNVIIAVLRDHQERRRLTREALRLMGQADQDVEADVTCRVYRPPTIDEALRRSL